MVNVLALIGALLAWMRGPRASRDAEFLFLRQQLLVLRRTAPARLRLTNSDRLILVWLYRLFPSLVDATVIFKPETLVAGIAAAFASSGAGNHQGAPDVLRYRAAFAPWFGR